MATRLRKGSPAGVIKPSNPAVSSNPLDAKPSFNPLNLNTDDIFGMQASFGNLDSDNATKYFMEAPKDFLTNFLRSNISDRKTLNAVVRSFDRYRRWEDSRHMQMLIDWLVGTRAIGSFSTIQGQQVAIQIMAEQLMLHMTGQKLNRQQLREMEADNDRQQALKAGQGGPSKV